MAELEFVIEVPERGRVVAFPSKSFVIGSDDQCQVCFKSSLIAERHAEVVKDTRGEWWIRDLMGTGSVVVNDSPIIDERLAPGDKLRVGDVVMTVRDSGVHSHSRTVSGETPMPTPEELGELEPDTVIDNRYKIIKRLATGGMGEVYRAVHVELGKPLALKVMLPELSGDSDFVARFKREAIASSRIGQQNIIDISDFGRTADGRFYFVMEFVDGKTLIKHRKEGPFPFARVVHVGLQIARALAAAHAVNIIHRDLKPENIMLVQRPGQPDFVKVLDFGIAKVISTTGTGAAFTAIGSVVGTPQYMSPEQASGLPVDARSDIYSLGLILHELVRGKPTFTGDSAVELMSIQLAKPPPALTSPHGPVPRALEQLISQMLQKAPEKRPASMEAVVLQLEAVAAYPTPASKTEPLPAAVPSKLPPTKVESSSNPLLSTLRALTPDQPVAKVNDPAVTSVNAPRQVTVRPPPAATRVQPLTPVPAPVVVDPSIHERAASDADSAAELAAVRPNRTPLIVGVLLVIVVLLVVAIVAVGREPDDAKSSGPELTAKTDPPPQPTDPQPKDQTAQPKEQPKEQPGEQPKEQPKQTVKTEAPATIVKLTLEATPQQAEVYEDDILLGATPLTLSRPPGTLTSLRLEAKGFKPLSRKVRFESDTTLKLELEKEVTRVKKTGGGPAKPRPPGDDDLMDLPE